MLKRLLYLNGLATFSVVLNHAGVWATIAMISWTDRYRAVAVPNYDQIGSFAFYVLVAVSGIIGYAITSFLFVSGFFVAAATGRSQRTIPFRIVISRIKYLLVPYLIWSLILILLNLLEGRTNTLVTYLRLLFTEGISGPYYYIPLLIQYYLLSPLLVILIKYNWKIVLLIIAIVQLLTQVSLYFEIFQISSPNLIFDTLPSWFFPTRIFWFVLGIVVGFHIKELRPLLERFRWQLLALTILFFAVTTIERGYIFVSHVAVPVETTIGSLYALSFIFMFLGFSRSRVPWANQIDAIGSKSFGIYLSHVPAQTYTARIIYNVFPWLLGYQVVFLLILVTAGLMFPLMMMAVVNRSRFRQFYRYIFG